MEKYFIYSLSKNEIVFYIGVTVEIEKRLIAHKANYGKDIVISILQEYYGSINAATALEQFWIKKHSDLGIKLTNKNLEDKDKLQVNCLQCEKQIFQLSGKREKKFCSGNCRVAYFRKNGKRGSVNNFDLKILYNEILDLAQKISSGQITAQPQKVYDAPKIQNNFQDEQKQWEESETDNLQVWKTQMNNCESAEELDYIGQGIASSSLSRVEKSVLNTLGKQIGKQKGFI